MTGVSVIVRKEISDAMSNGTFLLAIGILMISMVLSGVVSGDTYFKWSMLPKDGWGRIFVIWNVLTPVRVLGALVAMSFSFSSINKEKTEGSLKVLLSYPIYRDQVIIGKLLAGFLLISMVTLVSMGTAFSLYLYIITTAPTLDLLMRFGSVTLLAVLLLSSYLGLGMLLSVSFRDPKMTLLVMFLFLGVFDSYIFQSYGNIVTNAVFGYQPPYLGSGSVYGDVLNPQARAFQDFIASLNPSWGFTYTSLDLSFTTNVVFKNGVAVLDANGFVTVSTDCMRTLIDHIYSVGVLVVIPIITFAASYVLFTRRDIT
jgi:ABC-2 type transport system permease protein